MTENNKKIWDEAIDGIDEEYTDEAVEKLEKKIDGEINDNELIEVKKPQRAKFPVFAAAAAITAFIGVTVFVGMLATMQGVFNTTSSYYGSTLEEKFRNLDHEMRYDEVLQLLGEPYEEGGEYLKYLSYKLQDGRLAVVQFLYGDNPRIDFTYISSTIENMESDDAEYVLHRRLCDHENNYCSHDFYYNDTIREFGEKCKELKRDMSMEEVAEILGVTRDYGGGATTAFMYYYPDKYYNVYVEMNPGEPDRESYVPWILYRVYAVDKISGVVECFMHSSSCESERYYCVEVRDEYTKIEFDQLHLEAKLDGLGLCETDTLQDVLDYVGEPDFVEEVNEDITRLGYNYEDGKIGYICFYNSLGTSPIIDCSYTLDVQKNDIIYFTSISMSCISQTYYDLH